jgi:outer membrane lipoprotein SlyB
MFRRNISIILALVLLAGTGLLSSCASSRSAQVYSRDSAQQEMTVNYGTVREVRNVQIEGTKTGVGTVAGGVAGGILGSQIGGGAGRVVGGVLGALGGAAVGAVSEEGLTRRNGLEITVELDTGQLVTIVQEADIAFSPGERVRVLRANDGSSRVQK